MEQFQERLSRLAELSVEELNELEAEVTAAFDAADAEADLESMQALADALDEIRQAKSAKSSESAQAPVEEVEPAMAASAEPEPAATPESTPTAAPEQPEDTTDQPEQPEPLESAVVPEQPAEQPETTTAEDAPSDAPTTEDKEQPVTDITAADVPEENAPVVASARPQIIRAGGDIPGVTAGAPLDDMDAVVDALTRKIGSMRGVTGDGEHIVVASIMPDGEPPEERVLRAGDLNGNSRKIRALLSDREQLTPEGLTAAGWCAPRVPIYDVPTVGTTARPIRDSLPSFTADRGGITWAQPPAMPSSDFGVGIWRYENDAWGSHTNPEGTGSAGETKPCFTIECGTEQSADVDALTLCLCFNNMMTRAFPEWVRANTDLVMVAQSRFAEQVLLSQMFGVAATGSCGTPATSVGVARDFLFTVRTAAAAKRWELRIDPDSPLQLVAPSWVADAIAIDLGLQAPGDNTYSTSRDEVNGYFREANIDPIWFIDDAPGQAAFSGCAFPANAHWLLFPTGTFLRLDAGELNLGVVRTKEDLQKNAYCEFSETFETVAYMGPADAAWVVRGLTTVNLFGATGEPIDLSSS